MTLADAGRLLGTTGRFLATTDAGVVEATVYALDTRTVPPVLHGRTDGGVEIRVPLHRALAIGIGGAA